MTTVKSMCVTDFWGDWWDAVALWRTGAEMNSAVLCGYNIVWWGRLGKLFQFAAGMTVILDLAGPTRLKNVGEHAKERLTRISLRALPSRVRKQFSSAQRTVVWLAAAPAWLFGFGLPFYWMQVTVLKWDREFAFWGALIIAASVVLALIPRVGWLLSAAGLLTVYAAGYVKFGLPDYERMSWWEKGLLTNEGSDYLILIGALIAIAAGVVTFVALAASLVIALSLISSLYLATVIGASKGLEWTLNNANPGHALRYAAFAMFVVGFHFDLLAS
ncbi:hypothetical protein AB0J83_21630 [Actinoplanes sp. NPDC049596]|uniref:hypothetical protein n=1 Tax=unclassified Actinoplanes TaxID=2626549 RepID=UPI00341BA505